MKMIISILLLLPFPLIAEWQSLEEYQRSMESPCTADSECEVKDVGNCCGSYPGCVRTDANPDRKWVQQFCATNGIAGICGMPKIESCKCEQERCTPVIKTFGVLLQ